VSVRLRSSRPTLAALIAEATLAKHWATTSAQELAAEVTAD
jgi:hypothetical protein